MAKKKGLTRSQMRKLYTSVRKKGFPHSSAFRITGTAKRLSKRLANSPAQSLKFKKKHAYWDYDGDGKVNKYDCYPFDKRRQDNGEYLTREELKKRRAKTRKKTRIEKRYQLKDGFLEKRKVRIMPFENKGIIKTSKTKPKKGFRQSTEMQKMLRETPILRVKPKEQVKLIQQSDLEKKIEYDKIKKEADKKLKKFAFDETKTGKALKIGKKGYALSGKVMGATILNPKLKTYLEKIEKKKRNRKEIDLSKIVKLRPKAPT